MNCGGRRSPSTPKRCQRVRCTPYEELSSQGFRVLAVAYADVPERDRRIRQPTRRNLILGRFPCLFRSAAARCRARPGRVEARWRDGEDHYRRQRTGHRATSAGRWGLTPAESSLGEDLDKMTRRGAGPHCRATHGFRARLAGAEEPHHPGAEASRPRGGLHGRRHQRRAFAARGRRGHLRLDGGGRGARRRRHHPAGARPARAARRHPRRAARPSAT